MYNKVFIYYEQGDGRLSIIPHNNYCSSGSFTKLQ